MILEDAFTKLHPEDYHTLKKNLAVGDLIFCSGNGVISEIIKDATGSIFSHVGILLPLPVTDQWLVLESVETLGVRCVTLLEGYVKNYDDSGKGYDGKILIARHRQMQAQFKYVEALYRCAFSLIGDKYSNADIFRIASRIALNKVGIHEDGLVKERDRYICSEYVYACFKAVGISLPYDPLGFIAPVDIAKNPDVIAVAHLAVESRIIENSFSPEKVALL